MDVTPPRVLSTPLWSVAGVVIAVIAAVAGLTTDDRVALGSTGAGFPAWALDAGVLITAEGCAADSFGVGVVVEEGIVTNAHVVAGATHVTVSPGPEADAVDATVVAFDPYDDLALLRPDTPVGTALDVSLPSAGSDAFALARIVGVDGEPRVSPIDVRITRRIDIFISDIYGDGDYERAGLELVAEIGPGDSGAGIVTADGSLVGVVFSSSRGHKDVAYAISSVELAGLAGLAGPATGQGVATGRCRR